MKDLMRYLLTITGTRFPAGILIILGSVLLLTGELDRGLRFLLGGIGWFYLEEAIRAYRSAGTVAGEMNALKYMALLFAWSAVCVWGLWP